MVLSASITRDSSPPDATRASGRASWPTLSATRNSTSSAPVEAISARGASAARKWPSGMPSSGRIASTSRARRAAASTRFSLSAAAAVASAARAASRFVSSWRRSSDAVSTRSSSARAVRAVSIASSTVGPYFLQQFEQEIAPRLHGLEPRGIEIHAARVHVQFAREFLQRIEAVVEDLLQPRERRIDALDVRERALHVRELRERRAFLAFQRGGHARRQCAQFIRVLEAVRFVLQLRLFAGDELGVLQLAHEMAQIVRAPLGLGATGCELLDLARYA